MRNLINLIKKEVRELLTLSSITPVVVMALMFGVLGRTIGSFKEKAKDKPVIGIIDEDNSYLSNIATGILNQTAKVVYSSTGGSSSTEALSIVENCEGDALLIIPSGFSKSIYENHPGKIAVHWIMKGAGVMDGVPSGIIESLINIIGKEISKKLISNGSPADPNLVINPVIKVETTTFKGIEMEGISPGKIGSALSSQSTTVPLIMMIIIMMAGGTVLTSMGLEKENKTLETLLTLPVKRYHIIIGKVAGSAIAGLVIGAIYMVGFGYYMQSFQTTESGASLLQYGLTITSYEYALIAISVFLALLAGLSLCMLLGIFAKNYKSAQTLIAPISILAIIAMLATMFKDFSTMPHLLKVIIFLIPFSHPMMSVRALIFDDYALVLSGIVYVAIFSLILISIIARIFRTDRILTGGTRRRSSKRFRFFSF